MESSLNANWLGRYVPMNHAMNLGETGNTILIEIDGFGTIVRLGFKYKSNVTMETPDTLFQLLQHLLPLLEDAFLDNGFELQAKEMYFTVIPIPLLSPMKDCDDHNGLD